MQEDADSEVTNAQSTCVCARSSACRTTREHTRADGLAASATLDTLVVAVGCRSPAGVGLICAGGPSSAGRLPKATTCGGTARACQRKDGDGREARKHADSLETRKQPAAQGNAYVEGRPSSWQGTPNVWTVVQRSVRYSQGVCVRGDLT